MSESVDTFGLILNDLQMGSRTACHWVIDNSQKQKIELKIFRLFLPDDDTCESAFVEVGYIMITCPCIMYTPLNPTFK